MRDSEAGRESGEAPAAVAANSPGMEVTITRPALRVRARWWLAVGATWFLVLWFVDLPSAAWMLPRTQQEPWAVIRRVLWLAAAGWVQGLVILVVLGWALCARRRRATQIALRLVAVFLMATMLTSSLKYIVRRPRPQHLNDPRPPLWQQLQDGGWHSFPSGDVAVPAAVAVALWGLLGCPRRLRWLLVIPVLAGVQRFVAARHYPSDILAGAALGVWVALVVLARGDRWPLLRRWPMPGPGP